MLAGEAHGLDLALDAAVAEARRHQYARHAAQLLPGIGRRELLRIHVAQLHLAVIDRPGVHERLADRLVGVGQLGIFAHEGDFQRMLGVLDLLHEAFPRIHVGFLHRRQVEFGEHHLVQMLLVHLQRHLVDRGHVDRLHHGVHVHIAEERHLAPDVLREGMLRAQHEDVGLQAVFEQRLHGVLRGLGLHLARGGHVGNQREVHEGRVPGPELVAELTHRLDEGLRLDVAHRAADLGDDHVVLLALGQQLDAALDLVGDVGHHLHRLAEVLALALLLDHALVDAARSDVVRLRGRMVREALVVAEVEVGLGAVLRHVALTVLVGVERAGIDIDVRVEFLNRHRVAAGLQQPGDRRGDDALAERRSHTARDEYVLGFCQFHDCVSYLFSLLLS